MIVPLDVPAIKQGSKEVYIHKTWENVLMPTLKLTPMGVKREKKVVPPGSQRKVLGRVIEHGEEELEGITLANPDEKGLEFWAEP